MSRQDELLGLAACVSRQQLTANHGNIEAVSLDRFYSAIRECLLWTNEDAETIEPQGWETLKSIADEFLAIAKPMIESGELYMPDAYHQAGHDFALTIQGHGSGFWDRPEIWGEENADKLTELCDLIYCESYESDGEVQIMCGYQGGTWETLTQAWEASQ